MSQTPRRRHRAANPSITPGGYTAPVGLLGVISTIARTLGSSSASARSRSGTKPALAAQGKGRALMPSIAQVCWWFQNHGVGSRTVSPARAMAMVARKNAWLHPAVIATWSGRTVPP